MKVYILSVGSYDTYGIQGVYATPEAAMKAHSPKPTSEFKKWYRNQEPPPWEWSKERGEESWFFDAGGDSSADITAYEVQS